VFNSTYKKIETCFEIKSESDNKNLKPIVQAQIKKEEDQQIILKQNQQTIIDFLIDNKESIRFEDLKIYEPVYKSYREKRNCIICNRLSNIICINCSNYSKEIRLCTNHWQQHAIEKH
jgi:hypothetical protein